ncbi:MAG: putative DNA binding domain-containing protein [Oscillospiraceae bacterium]|nr:putative DNA binding domain-containing protein [Oscillospiraceae bacterium]
MTIERIRQFLSSGEGLTIEFKECVNELSNSIWETVCSFSNRYGGNLILGVNDNGEPIGVNPKAIQQLKKNFTNTLNNPQKVSPSLFLNLSEVEVDGCILLHVYVPVSSQIQLCSGRIYDRNEDGDFDITNSSELVAQLALRKSTAYTEREIFPYVTENELRLDLVERAQKMAIALNADHPWKGMTPTELLRNTGLYEDDWRTGKRGYNLAAILLFGCDDVIRSCAPGYMTDALLRKENIDRYDDRLIVGTNLIDAYDQLIDFISKHTLDRFFLVDNQRVSVRSWIARELISNILVHREYSKGFMAKIVVEKDRIYAENWNRSNRYGHINPDDFTPDAKNPLLAWFFVNIGRADWMGSGIRNLYKYTKIYSGGEPELIEGDIFKTIIPIGNGSYGSGIVNNGTLQYRTEDGQVNGQVNGHVNEHVNEHANRMSDIVTILKLNPRLTIRQIAAEANISYSTARRRIDELKNKGIIERIGSDKTGNWRIIEAE